MKLKWPHKRWNKVIFQCMSLCSFTLFKSHRPCYIVSRKRNPITFNNRNSSYYKKISFPHSARISLSWREFALSIFIALCVSSVMLDLLLAHTAVNSWFLVSILAAAWRIFCEHCFSQIPLFPLPLHLRFTSHKLLPHYCVKIIISKGQIYLFVHFLCPCHHAISIPLGAKSEMTSWCEQMCVFVCVCVKSSVVENRQVVVL
jgi:hypothetical protein